MTERSARFALPFILPGQAQKEVFHNEALAMADALLHPVVEGPPLAAPPAAPAEGRCWIVAAGATGAWAGEANRIAAWTAGGWRFLAPVPGLLAWNRAAGHWLHWTGTAWGDGTLPVAGISVGGKKVVGTRQPAVPSPSGGTTIDAEARAALNAVIVALKTHGLID
jgi:hypothetical protein